MKYLLIFFTILFTFGVAGAADSTLTDNIFGVQGGAFIQDGQKPELAYCFVTDISVEKVPLINSLMKKVEASVFYSNRTQPEVETMEIYGARMFTVRQYMLYKSLYCGVGVGYYYFFNSEGADEDCMAGRLELGLKLNDIIEVYLGADALRTHTTMVYPHLSISLLK